MDPRARNARRLCEKFHEVRGQCYGPCQEAVKEGGRSVLASDPCGPVALRVL
jgi:hypothetical protein